MAHALAAVHTEPKKALEIREYPVLSAPEGSLRLDLTISGICGTDIHIIEGCLAIPAVFIPGHEFIGTVAEQGKGATKDGLGSKLEEGNAVIACVALPCGTCFSCQHGETASCLNFGVSNIRDPKDAPHFFGGFAEALFQPAKTCVKIPAKLDIEAVSALPCAGPTAIRAFDFAGNLQGDELVVVQGTGPVGLFAIAWAAKAGCRVVAIGSGGTPARTAAAKQLGASEVLDYRAMPEASRLERIQAIAKEMGRGNGADVVFEASGSPKAVPEGLNLVRTLGRYIIPGQYSSSGEVAIKPELITFKAIKIIGSGQYKLSDIKTYLDFLKDNADLQAELKSLISHRFAVKDANAAIETVSGGKAVKAVFVK